MGGSEDPVSLGSFPPAPPAWGRGYEGWAADCVSWNHLASPGTDPVQASTHDWKGLSQWVGEGFVSHCCPQFPAQSFVHVDLEMADQKVPGGTFQSSLTMSHHLECVHPRGFMLRRSGPSLQDDGRVQRGS